MVRFLALAIAAALLLIAPKAEAAGTCQRAGVSVAAGFKPLCTWNQIWQGPCNGGNISWNTAPPSVPGKLTPWETEDITIVATEMTFFNSGHILYAELGNGGGSPDPMVHIGEGETHGYSAYPSGTGMAFYGRSNGSSGFIDTHIACNPTPSAGQFNVFATFYYVVN